MDNRVTEIGSPGILTGGMSFSIRLTQDLVTAEPGASVPVALLITNKEASLDRYELEIDGIDPEWKAVPVPVFNIDPGVEHTERFFLRPPRASESLAGNYPFVVRVRSLESGETKTVQGILEVEPFHHLSMEISPKKGYVTPVRKQNSFLIAIVNLGNTEHRLQLSASDPEDACAFEFEQDHVTIGPGQQKEIELVADPTSTKILSSGKLIGFSVTGRSLSVPSVSSSAQAQLEQRALLSPTSLGVLFIFLVVFGLWLWNMPKPPKIEFTVDKTRITQGESVTVRWSASNAKSVRIATADGQVVYEGANVIGSQNYSVSDAGSLVFHATATVDGRTSAAPDISIVVDPQEVVPDPEITMLKPDKTKVRLGESFILRFSFSSSVTKAMLAPSGEELDPVVGSREIKPSQAGTQKYELVASNKVGKTVRKPFVIEVVDESEAAVLDFHAAATVISPDQGSVNLTWQVTNAVRVEIKPNGGDPVLVEPQGSQDFPISAKTTFTLTAFDAKGRPTTKNLTVSMARVDPPATEGSTTGIVPTTTGETLPPDPATTGGTTNTTGR